MRIASAARASVMVASMLVLGCAGGDGGVPLAEDAVLESWDGEQTHERVVLADLEAVRALLAFEPVFPAALPPNVRLASALVIVPPAVVVDAEQRREQTSVMLTLIDEGGTWLSLDEQVAPRGTGAQLGGSTEVEIGGVRVERRDTAPEPGFPRGLRRALWVSCGAQFGLASTFERLTAREFEAVVASFIEGCEPVRTSGTR